VAKVAVKYTFIFEPAETWATVSGFESDLGALLSTRGLIAELIETQGDNTRYVFVTKAPMIAEAPKPKSPQQVMQQLRQHRDEKGKFLNVK
jgi:hypothetical protein